MGCIQSSDDELEPRTPKKGTASGVNSARQQRGSRRAQRGRGSATSSMDAHNVLVTQHPTAVPISASSSGEKIAPTEVIPLDVIVTSIAGDNVNREINDTDETVSHFSTLPVTQRSNALSPTFIVAESIPPPPPAPPVNFDGDDVDEWSDPEDDEADDDYGAHSIALPIADASGSFSAAGSGPGGFQTSSTNRQTLDTMTTMEGAGVGIPSKSARRRSASVDPALDESRARGKGRTSPLVDSPSPVNPLIATPSDREFSTVEVRSDDEGAMEPLPAPRAELAVLPEQGISRWHKDEPDSDDEGGFGRAQLFTSAFARRAVATEMAASAPSLSLTAIASAKRPTAQTALPTVSSIRSSASPTGTSNAHRLSTIGHMSVHNPPPPVSFFNVEDIDPLALESALADELAYEKFCYGFAAQRLAMRLRRCVDAASQNAKSPHSNQCATWGDETKSWPSSMARITSVATTLDSLQVAVSDLVNRAVLNTAVSNAAWNSLSAMIDTHLSNIQVRCCTASAHARTSSSAVCPLADLTVAWERHQAPQQQSVPTKSVGFMDAPTTTIAWTDGVEAEWSDNEEVSDEAPVVKSPLVSLKPDTDLCLDSATTFFTAADWLEADLARFSHGRKAALGRFAEIQRIKVRPNAPSPCGKLGESNANASATSFVDDVEDYWARNDEKNYIGMDEVVPGVFVGSFHPAQDLAHLNRHNITHIVSCLTAADVALTGHDEHTILDMVDRSDQILVQHAEITVNVLRRVCLEESRSMLVHCGSGVSRAPAVVIWAFATLFNYSADVSASLVRIGRPTICLNVGFRQQLITKFPDPYARSLHSGSPCVNPGSFGRLTPSRVPPSPLINSQTQSSLNRSHRTPNTRPLPPPPSGVASPRTYSAESYWPLTASGPASL
jgi:predicted protein tyrosine phosphatase